jgi:formylglycine-generating enzyme required for sulfatase activity
VGYNYNIGKYEVTAGQYAAFLNAVAATDTYGLYNRDMARTDYGSGITQHNASGSYTYTVDAAFVNRPVNYVSFWDACRFANWLNNGQGGPGTTEYGTYTLTPSAISSNTVTRNAGATWGVTSEDEWYKAAYYNPVASNYYLYPTSSNWAPSQIMADPLGNCANYFSAPYAFPIDGTHYTTVAGEFQNSDSPYETFDQAGNVCEWNEAIINSSYRGLRGGTFGDGDFSLQSGGRGIYDPAVEYSGIGFRVSQVPEPSCLAVLGIGVVGMLLGRRGARM